MLASTGTLNYGYPWWLSYGHVVILVPAALALVIAYVRKWPKGMRLVIAAVVLWSLAAFLVIRFGFNANATPSLPTESFLARGQGKVLDIGAGTGRSSIMVLQSRPDARLVALDGFAESFTHHFGPENSPQAKLLANLQAANVADRATITTADMRSLPFPAADFDALVSAYAIDHLNGDGIRQALLEAARVVKPGGDFLLILVADDKWTKFAFGPMLAHGGTRGADWWSARLQEARFEVVESGTRPATLFFLARRQS